LQLVHNTRKTKNPYTLFQTGIVYGGWLLICNYSKQIFCVRSCMQILKS